MAYSVPTQAAQLLRKGILQNPMLKANIPNDASSLADHVIFTGNASPNIPINWRFAESISALKGLESVWINALLKAKYNHGPVKVGIDT